MDPINLVHVDRARKSLDVVASSAGQQERARAFVDAARTILRAGNSDPLQALRSSRNPLVAKAAAHLALDADFDAASGEMADAYLESISELSIIDMLKRYGSALPAATGRVVIASDAVGDVVAEGELKPVKRLSLSQSSPAPVKSTAMLVMSDELASATDGKAEALFEHELRAAVARASNASILAALAGSSPTTVTGTGDPLTDLRLGLGAAAPSSGYVVAMPSGAVAALATTIEAGPAFTVRGGEFRPGIHVVAVDGVDDVTVIPASRVALWDSGLSLRSARHANVDLRDTIEGQPVHTSLWQENLLGLLVERSWSLAQADGVIIVEQPEG